MTAQSQGLTSAIDNKTSYMEYESDVLHKTTVNKDTTSREEKLEKLNQRIEELRQKKQSSMLKALGGLGATAIGWAIWDPLSTSNTVSTLFIVGGSVFSVWGIYEWADAANTMSRLEQEKYDLSVAPSIERLPNNEKAFALSLKFSLK